MVARPGVQVDRVEQRAPDVVLLLVVGAVADPHRPRALVAGQVVEALLGEPGLAVDPVHDLQDALLPLGHVGDEVEEVVGLPVEAERVEPPQHERGVANPREAVVPVALAARTLGQRRGGGRHQCARGRVGQPLERERASLQVGAPGVVGKGSVVEPVLPVVSGPDEAVVSLLVVAWRRVGGPRERHEEGVALLHQRAARGPRSLEADVHVGGERELQLGARAHALGLAIGGAGVLPGAGRPAVVEARLTVERHLHLPVDAANQAQHHVIGVVVGGRAPVSVGAIVLVVPGTYEEHVSDDDPAAARAPARLEHVRSRQVAPRRRHVHVRRSEPEHAGVAIEYGAKNAGRVEPRQAEPLDV